MEDKKKLYKKINIRIRENACSLLFVLLLLLIAFRK